MSLILNMGQFVTTSGYFLTYLTQTNLEFLSDINQASSMLEDEQARLINVHSIYLNKVPDPEEGPIKQVIHTKDPS